MLAGSDVVGPQFPPGLSSFCNGYRLSVVASVFNFRQIVLFQMKRCLSGKYAAWRRAMLLPVAGARQATGHAPCRHAPFKEVSSNQDRRHSQVTDKKGTRQTADRPPFRKEVARKGLSVSESVVGRTESGRGRIGSK